MTIRIKVGRAETSGGVCADCAPTARRTLEQAGFTTLQRHHGYEQGRPVAIAAVYRRIRRP